MSNPASQIPEEDLRAFLKKPHHTFPGLANALRSKMERLVNRGPTPAELHDWMESYPRRARAERASKAVAEIQATSVKNGVNKLTAAEIDAEIDATRAERKSA